MNVHQAIAWGLAALVLAACQANPDPQLRVKRPARTQSTGVSQAEALAAGWVPSGTQPTPRQDATPMADGHATPLPLSAFPPDSTSTGGSSGSGSGGGSTAATPTPLPAATVPPLQPAVVLSNSLPAGRGSIGGILLDVPHGMTPVGEATVTITLESDSSKQARLRNASNGTYQLGGLALGTYLVRAERSGYVGDGAPIVVTLSTSSSAPGTVNMVLVKQ